MLGHVPNVGRLLQPGTDEHRQTLDANSNGIELTEWMSVQLRATDLAESPGLRRLTDPGPGWRYLVGQAIPEMAGRLRGSACVFDRPSAAVVDTRQLRA
jgi:hypothetical protein